MPRADICQHTALQRAAGWGGSTALERALTLFKRQGGPGDEKVGQHCTLLEMKHLNKLTLVEEGF